MKCESCPFYMRSANIAFSVTRRNAAQEETRCGRQEDVLRKWTALEIEYDCETRDEAVSASYQANPSADTNEARDTEDRRSLRG